MIDVFPVTPASSRLKTEEAEVSVTKPERFLERVRRLGSGRRP